MWWDNLNLAQQILFIVGCATTIVMIIQVVLMLIGFNADDAFDGDGGGTDNDVDFANDEGADNIGLKVISLRTIIAFLCIGSWVGFTVLFFTEKWYLVTPAALVGGAAAGLAVAFIMRAAMKMQSNGVIDIKNCVGKIGEVYLTIPAKRGGNGKINVFVQERWSEFEAATDYDSPIKTGSQIKISGVINEGLLLVEPLAIDKEVNND